MATPVNKEAINAKMKQSWFSEQEMNRVNNSIISWDINAAKNAITSTIAKKPKATTITNPVVSPTQPVKQPTITNPQPKMYSASVNPASVIWGSATINANVNAPMWQQFKSSWNIGTSTSQVSSNPMNPNDLTIEQQRILWEQQRKNPAYQNWTNAPDVTEKSNLTEMPANTYVGGDWKRYYMDSATGTIKEYVGQWTPMTAEWQIPLAWTQTASANQPQTNVWEPQAPTIPETTQTAPKTQNNSIVWTNLQGNSADLNKYNQLTQQALAKWMKMSEATQFATEAMGGQNPATRNYEILTNLNEWFKNAPELFRDYSTFQKAYWYAWKSPEERQTLDWFFQSKQPQGVDWFLSIVNQWGKISAEQYRTNPQAAEAQHIYDIMKPYIWASSWDLYLAMRGGKIVPGSDAYKELVKVHGGIETPDMIEAKARYASQLKADSINQDSNIKWGAPVVKADTTQTVSDKLVSQKGIDYATQFKNDVANNPEIVELAWKVTAIDNEIADMETEKKNVMKKLVKDHPWITSYALYAASADIIAPLNEAIELKQNERNKYASDLQYKWELASKMFEYKFKQQESELAYARQLQSEQAQREFQKQQIAEQRDYAAKQFEIEQAYAHPDINSTNPQIANIALQNTIGNQLKFAQENGIPVQRDMNTIIADAQAYSQQYWVPLSQALQDTFITPFQSKQEYKDAIANIQYSKSPTGKLQVIWQRVDPITGTVSNVYGTVDKSWNIVETSNPMNVEPVTQWAWINKTGAELYKAMTASTNPIGVYATGDMTGERHAFFYNEWSQRWLEKFINQYKWTKITPDMVRLSAEKYWVDPMMIAATMAFDSSMGTKWLWAKNNNPWNVWQFDSLWTQAVKWYATLQDGIDAVANNLAKRQNALWLWVSQVTWIPKLAQDYIDWKITIPSWKDKDRVIKYISDNNMINWKTGNMKFIGESNTEKQAMASMIKMKEDLETVKNIPNLKDYVGKWDSWTLWTATWMNSDPVRAKIKTILNTNLNNYIKDITGATVGKDEAPRLIATQPTIWQSDTDFMENLDSSLRLLENKISALTNDYNFDSPNDLAKKVIWRNLWQTTHNGTTQVNTNNIDSQVDEILKLYNSK